MTTFSFYETRLGLVRIACEDGVVTGLRFAQEPDAPHAPCAVSDRAAAEIAEYLAGRRAAFTFPKRQPGTPFEQAVWAAVTAIAYGETRTYGQLAAALGRPRAARAVGAANAKNALPWPCPATAWWARAAA